MWIAIFILSVLLLMLLMYKQTGRLMVPTTILAIPYLFIIPLNNYFATRIGFEMVRDETIIMLLCGIALFAAGEFMVNAAGNNKLGLQICFNEQYSDKFANYDIKGMAIYVGFVEIIVLLRAFYIIISRGIAFFISDANEGYLLTGLLGHLFLSIFPLVPILFLYWLKRKKNVAYLLMVVSAIVLLFLTFVKYHVICEVVLIYIFIAAEDRRYLMKGAIFIVVFAISLFVLSYVITFIVRNTFRGTNVMLYFNQLWKYIAGSVINDNVIFDEGLSTNYSTGYKGIALLFVFPNMFIYKLIGRQFLPVTGGIGMKSYFVNKLAYQQSNVIDQIGYLYSPGNSLYDKLWFCVLLFVMGAVARSLFINAYRKKNEFSMGTWAYICFFVFFSFFATYAVLTTTWEIIVWGAIMPTLFRKHKKLVLGEQEGSI